MYYYKISFMETDGSDIDFYLIHEREYSYNEFENLFYMAIIEVFKSRINNGLYEQVVDKVQKIKNRKRKSWETRYWLLEYINDYGSAYIVDGYDFQKDVIKYICNQYGFIELKTTMKIEVDLHTPIIDIDNENIHQSYNVLSDKLAKMALKDDVMKEYFEKLKTLYDDNKKYFKE